MARLEGLLEGLREAVSGRVGLAVEQHDTLSGTVQIN